MTVTDALLALIAFLLLLAVILLAAIVAGTEGPRAAIATASGWISSTLAKASYGVLSYTVKVLLVPTVWVFTQVGKIINLPIHAVQFLFRPLMRFSWLVPLLEFIGVGVGFVYVMIVYSIVAFTVVWVIGYLSFFFLAFVICGSLDPASCFPLTDS